MVENTSERIAAAVSEAFADWDPSGVKATLSDAAFLHVGGGSGLSGNYQGPEAIGGLLDRMTDLTNATIRLTGLNRPTFDGRRVVLEGRAEAIRSGRELSTSVRLELLIESEWVREIWLDCADQSRFDDFWQ